MTKQSLREWLEARVVEFEREHDWMLAGIASQAVPDHVVVGNFISKLHEHHKQMQTEYSSEPRLPLASKAVQDAAKRGYES